jgi:FAD-dependent monooxygenase
VFEKWLKGLCNPNPLIDLRFGCKVESIEELPDGVKMNAVYMKDGKRTTILSRYVAGCDGASSKVRRGLNIPLDGGPT